MPGTEIAVVLLYFVYLDNFYIIFSCENLVISTSHLMPYLIFRNLGCFVRNFGMKDEVIMK